MEYKTLYKEESYGDIGNFSIELIVGTDKFPDTNQKEIMNAVYSLIEPVKSEIKAAIKQEDPGIEDEIKKNRELCDLFPEPIFVEEIPNKYCGDWCCRHLPWFVVTTKVGRFEIGWRNHVIQIDWCSTVGTLSSEELFPEEDVTMGDKFIDAWSKEDAKRYIKTIIENAEEV